MTLNKLREAWSEHPDVASSLRAWNKLAKSAVWANLVEVRATFPTADLVGDKTVFNVKGNHYRLITRIVFERQTVLILALLTHAEYDKGRWK